MGRNRDEEGALAAFFDAARAARPEPDARLLAAVLADAEATLSARPKRRAGLAAAAAMAASAALGFWIGATGTGPVPEGTVFAGVDLEAVSALEPDAIGFFSLDWEG